MSEPLTEETLDNLLEQADRAEKFRAEDDGHPYEQYGEANWMDREWVVAMEPDEARALVAEVRRLRSLIQHRVNRQWDHGRGCTPCDEFEKVAESWAGVGRVQSPDTP